MSTSTAKLSDEYSDEVFDEEPEEEYEEISENLSETSEPSTHQSEGSYEEDEDDSNVELAVSCNTPSDFNSNDHAYHLNFLHQSLPKLPEMGKKYKNGTRKSLSFSNERMREIERHNHILLQKILTKSSTYAKTMPKKNNYSQFAKNPPTVPRVTSAAVNRRKQQRQIDLDNQVLRRKIEKISSRRSLLD